MMTSETKRKQRRKWIRQEKKKKKDSERKITEGTNKGINK